MGQKENEGRQPEDIRARLRDAGDNLRQTIENIDPAQLTPKRTDLLTKHPWYTALAATIALAGLTYGIERSSQRSEAPHAHQESIYPARSNPTPISTNKDGQEANSRPQSTAMTAIAFAQATETPDKESHPEPERPPEAPSRVAPTDAQPEQLDEQNSTATSTASPTPTDQIATPKPTTSTATRTSTATITQPSPTGTDVYNPQSPIRIALPKATQPTPTHTRTPSPTPPHTPTPNYAETQEADNKKYFEEQYHRLTRRLASIGIEVMSAEEKYAGMNYSFPEAPIEAKVIAMTAIFANLPDSVLEPIENSSFETITIMEIPDNSSVGTVQNDAAYIDGHMDVYISENFSMETDPDTGMFRQNASSLSHSEEIVYGVTSATAHAYAEILSASPQNSELLPIMLWHQYHGGPNGWMVNPDGTFTHPHQEEIADAFLVENIYSPADHMAHAFGMVAIGRAHVAANEGYVDLDFFRDHYGNWPWVDVEQP